MKSQITSETCKNAAALIQKTVANSLQGRSGSLSGSLIEISGLSRHAAVGDRLTIRARDDAKTEAEIVGFKDTIAHAMSFSSTSGVGPGNLAVLIAPRSASSKGYIEEARTGGLAVCESWIGRIIDPLGIPIDQRGSLSLGLRRKAVRGSPPNPTLRARLGERLDVGVRAINLFATCRKGQRLGLFAGSGVGKSTLLAMLARNTACDISVVALVGERGREVREFVEDCLGRDGLSRTIIVVATSDQPPLMRREAAYAAMTIAEHFRDEGKSVMLLMDSVTRFCLALREIGLLAGEPPASRGYTPSVFAELPQLLERAGPGIPANGKTGYITGIFTVLVEGDDHNEPVSDAVRGILDGHVVLDRRIGEAGRYPAIDILRSLSRSVPGCNSDIENALTRQARAAMALHADMSDLIKMGAYRIGADPSVDSAIRITKSIEQLLTQHHLERSDIAESFAALKDVLPILEDNCDGA